MSVKTILITGGAGFVGSSLAIGLKAKYPAYTIISLDSLKRRGSELNLARLSNAGIKFIHGDIRNKEDLESIEEKIDVIIDASAEPSVLSGINSSPDYVINTNLVGSINCLNLALRNKSDFIFLSTSRVYPIEKIDQIGIQEDLTRFTISPEQTLPGITDAGISEQFPLDGYRSLYGATKLATEILIAEYRQYYNLNTIVNRCGVLTGPWQMGKVDQGVVVLWVARHFWKKSLSYIGYGGTGKQVRDILHFRDFLRLVDLQIHNMSKFSGEIFNIGGGLNVSVSLQELTSLCESATGNRLSIAKVEKTREADVKIYITDNSKVTKLTDWVPLISKDQIIAEIYEWLVDNEDQLKSILS